MRTEILISGLVSLLSTSAYSDSSGGSLPPKAEAAFDLGVAAYKEKHWDVALRQFAEAQTAAPRAPQVLFNLGLAHAAAGHEVISIPWFMAYLAVAPNASNATAVRGLIDKAKSKARLSGHEIFQETLRASLGVPDEMLRWGVCVKLIGWAASVGETDLALEGMAQCSKIFGKAELDKFDQSYVWAKTVDYLASTGHVKEARLAYARIGEPFYRLDALCVIAIAEARLGDTAASQGTLSEAKTIFENLENGYNTFYGPKPPRKFDEAHIFDLSCIGALYSREPFFDSSTVKVVMTASLSTAIDVCEKRTFGADIPADYRYESMQSLGTAYAATKNFYESARMLQALGLFRDQKWTYLLLSDRIFGEFAVPPIKVLEQTDAAERWLILAHDVEEELGDLQETGAAVRFSSERETPARISMALGITAFFVERALAQIEVVESSWFSQPRPNLSPLSGVGGTEQDSRRSTWTDWMTGLEWVRRDNGTNVDWIGARSYCENLRLGGYSDWRLPTRLELGTIWHRPPSDNRPPPNGSYTIRDPWGRERRDETVPYWIEGGIAVTGSAWSSTQKDPEEAFVQGFSNGAGDTSERLTDTYGYRALCVRRSKSF